MTIVAWDGKALSSDKQDTWGGCKRKVTNVTAKVNGKIRSVCVSTKEETKRQS